MIRHRSAGSPPPIDRAFADILRAGRTLFPERISNLRVSSAAEQTNACKHEANNLPHTRWYSSYSLRGELDPRSLARPESGSRPSTTILLHSSVIQTFLVTGEMFTKHSRCREKRRTKLGFVTDVSMETAISVIDRTVATTFGHPRDTKLMM